MRLQLPGTEFFCALFRQHALKAIKNLDLQSRTACNITTGKMYLCLQSMDIATIRFYDFVLYLIFHHCCPYG